MIIKDPGFLRYGPGLKDQVPKIDIPKKAEPIFIKEKLEQILAEDPDNPLKEKLSSAVSVEISEEGKKLSESVSNSTENYKEAGVTSQREPWESCSKEFIGYDRKDWLGNDSMLYAFRVEDPDGYADYIKLLDEAINSRIKKHDGVTEIFDWNEDSLKLLYKAYSRFSDFRDLKYQNDPQMNRNSVRRSTIDILEKTYSDSKHDLSINTHFTGEDLKPKNIFSGASLWRYSTKFNMLMSTDLLEKLTYGSDDDKRNILKVIDKSVNEMKDIEKAYSGNKEFLRFGVTLDDNGKVSYHANYKDCSNPYGIEANSADDLLKKLMSDN